MALHILSLGAGVQSSVMALMAARGVITPMPDAAIFADTQWEPKAVYEHLDWLETQLPFPVYRVSDGNIRDDILKASRGGRWVSIPAFVDGGMVRRQCTKEYKLVPLRRKIRQLLGIHGKRSPMHPVVQTWIGISTDEASRMKPSREDWQEHKFPLIEANMSRGDCQEWFKNRYPGRSLPKSACIGCPYRKDAQWRDLTEDEFAEAVEVDGALRTGFKDAARVGYLHRSLKPLDEVDFRSLEDMGQLNLFNEECEGMCGL